MGLRPTFHGEKSLEVLILFAGVLLLDPFIPGAWENLAFSFVAIVGAWLLTEKGTPGRYFMLFLLCVFLAVLTAVAFLPKNVMDSIRRPMGLTLLIVTLALMGFSARLLLGSLWRATVINAAQIISTVNLYILVGMCWAYLYALVNWLDPSSFDLPSTGTESISNLIYFSFVTLASVGYGDIVPQTPFAQRLAITEAIMGQFYTAVLVAYLLSIYIGQKTRESGTRSNDGPSCDNHGKRTPD